MAEEALQKLKNWQGASLLPIDQMIMTIAMRLLVEPAQLALGAQAGGHPEKCPS